MEWPATRGTVMANRAIGPGRIKPARPVCIRVAASGCGLFCDRLSPGMANVIMVVAVPPRAVAGAPNLEYINETNVTGCVGVQEPESR